MGDEHFSEILSKLFEIHNEFNDIRFGVVIQNSIDKYRRTRNKDLTDVSSKDFLAALEEFQRATRVARGK